MSAFTPNPSQTLVLECRDQLCVIAGAGSGKTGTLVETLARRLAEGAPGPGAPPPAGPAEARPGLDVTDLLALTFTEKAAAELRQRLGRAFDQRRRAALPGSAEAEFWRGQGARLDRADIGTIHGYALKLVRENALTLGLAASPELDEDERSLGRDLAEILTDWLDEGDPALLGLLRHYPLATLRGMLGLVAARQSSWGLGRLWADLDPPAGEFGQVPAAFPILVHEALDQLRSGGLVNPDKAYFPKILAAQERLARLWPNRAAEDIDGLLARSWRLLREGGDWYSKPGRLLKKSLAAALENLQTLRTDQLAVPIKEKFLDLVNRLPERLAGRKKNRGVITFDDILLLARRLLARHPPVRQREIRRRRLILIDEFQDTNRLQANLLGYLLLRPEDETVYDEDHDIWQHLEWADLSPRFSAFGDPKQSIYRFRGAEVEVMTGLGRAFDAGGGRVLALDHNYRSQEPLICFFNALFPEQLEDGFTDRDRQAPVRPPLYDGPHVVQLRSVGPPPRRAAERAEAQARLLVRYLADMFQGRGAPGQVLFEDDQRRVGRPGPGQVAVLFRRFRWAGLFKSVLEEAGWKCCLASGDNPFTYDEVRGLLAAFQYLSGQDEEISLAAALRSPLGPVGDDTLARLTWPDEEGSPPVRLTQYFAGGQSRPWPSGLDEDDVRVLEEVRALFLALAPLTGRLRPVEILERLVEERRLVPLAGLEPDAEDRVRALTAFLALSRTVGRRPDSPLSPAEELMEKRREWDPRRDGGEARAEGGEPALTLMTVHGAKGLEFPVVVLAETDRRSRVSASPAVLSGDGQVALSFKSPAGETGRPSDFQKLRDVEKSLDARENSRLLYVAATRARDHLVFLGFPDQGGRKPAEDDAPAGPPTVWLEALRQCPAAASLTAEVEYDLLETPAGPAIALPAASDGPAGPPAAPALLEPPGLVGQALAVTALSQLLADPEAFYREKHLGLGHDFHWSPGQEFFADPAPQAPETGGRMSPQEAGLLFHAVLERLDPARPAAAALLAEAVARRGLAPTRAEADELTAGVEAFLAGPLGQAWRAGRASGRPDRREFSFFLKVPGPDNRDHLTLTGTIDLFFITADGAGQIVDYKRKPPRRPEELAAYENQVRVYAQALRSGGFGGPLAAALYFAGDRPPSIHPVPLAEPEPLAPLLPLLRERWPLLVSTRPLRPNRPGAVGPLFQNAIYQK